MKLWDIIAYHYDGAAYCPACAKEYLDTTDEECNPVFAEYLENEIGSICDHCRACLDENGDWLTTKDITDKKYYRWAAYEACNDQLPHEIRGYNYRDDRLAALQGKLVCRNCLKPAVHF